MNPRGTRRPPIMLTLFVLFTAVTLIELWLIVQMARLITWPVTILLAIVSGIIGSAMVKREGLSVLRKGQTELASGRFPAGPIAEGVVLLVGGAFLITPGLLTDVVGLSTLMPPCRRVYAKWLVAWARRNVKIINPSAPFQQPRGGNVFDAEQGSYSSPKTHRHQTNSDDTVDVEFRRVD